MLNTVSDIGLQNAENWQSDLEDFFKNHYNSPFWNPIHSLLNSSLLFPTLFFDVCTVNTIITARVCHGLMSIFYILLLGHATSWVVQKLTWLRYTPGLDTHLARIHTWLKYTPVLDTYLVWIPPWFWSTPGLDTHLAWIHTCLKYIPGSDTHLVLVNTWLEYTPGLDTHLDSGSCQHLAWMCTFCNVLWYSQPEWI